METNNPKLETLKNIILVIIILVTIIIIIVMIFKKPKTTRELLIRRCPIDPKANNMINVGNSARYEDYLFSACTDASTCDKPGSMIDPISNTLLNNKAHCGSWLIDAPGYNSYTWNQTEKKWKNR